jgi:HlyD family secretion protein
MKKVIAYPLIGIIVVTGAYFLYNKFSTTSSTTTGTNIVITVASGSIRNTVKATGKVYPVQESNLTFTRQGTITAIYKKVGDTVKAGELIAELDAKSMKLDVASAKLSIANAQNNLNKVLGWSTETERIKMTNTILDAQARLIQLKKDAENLLIEQKYTLENARTNIDTLTANLALAQSELVYAQNTPSTTQVSTIEQDMTQAFSLVQSIYDWLYDQISLIDTTLSIENKNNPQYWAIGGNNPELKTQIDTLYTRIKKDREDLIPVFVDLKNKSNSLPSVFTALDTMKKITWDINTLTALSISALRASTIGANISQWLVDTKISTLTKLATTLGTSITNITTTTTNLKNHGDTSQTDLATSNTISSKKLNVSNAQNSLIKAKQDLIQTQANYESRILTSQQSITSQENTIKLATATYNDTINGNSTDVVAARNNIQSAQISLAKTELALRDYQIYATFDGVIRDIPWVVGDTVTASSSSTAENISITNSGGYEIRVSLDQADVVKIKPGMSARISLDAYANSNFSGTVSSVSPTPTETSGVVSYTAKILLPTTDKEIYSNMSATVTIITSEVTGVIVVPSRAVKSIKWKTYVNTVTTNSPTATPTQTEVTLGITDGNNIEIISGVVVGDKLLISGGSSRTGSGSGNRSVTNTPNILGGLGGGGGGNWWGGFRWP